MRNGVAVLLALLALGWGAAEAHQPRLVDASTSVEVDSPEVSKAYYGEFPGQAVTYIIRAAAPFKLYVGLLVPDAPGAEPTVSAQIFQNHVAIANLSGDGFEWKRFHEPYGGDDYLQGPEFTADAQPGLWEIYVFDKDNQGKYVVAIGEKEKWPPSEIWSTLRVLPKLKKDFFGKSPSSFLTSGMIGRYLLGTIIVIVAIVAIVVTLVVRRSSRRPSQPASDAPGR